MTTQTEALKLALDWCYCLEDGLSDEGVLWHVRVRTLLTDLVPAIKEALAQPAVPQGHKQEPVAWAIGSHIESDYVFAKETPLYTTPPQRTWVGLTDEQIETIANDYGAGGWICDFARAIEAAHGIKEKNT